MVLTQRLTFQPSMCVYIIKSTDNFTIYTGAHLGQTLEHWTNIDLPVI